MAAPENWKTTKFLRREYFRIRFLILGSPFI